MDDDDSSSMEECGSSEDESSTFEKFVSGELSLKQLGDGSFRCNFCALAPKKDIQSIFQHANCTTRDKQKHQGLARYISEFKLGLEGSTVSEVMRATAVTAMRPASPGSPPSPSSPRSPQHPSGSVDNLPTNLHKRPPKRGTWMPLVDKREVEQKKADCIIVPPVFVLGNLNIDDSLSEQEEQLHVGNPELRDAVEKFFNWDVRKYITHTKLYYDSRGRPTGQAFILFEDSVEGHFAADRQHKTFERLQKGRPAWEKHCNLPRDLRRRTPDVFGYLASVEDMNKLDPKKKRVKNWRTIDAAEQERKITKSRQEAEEAKRQASAMHIEAQKHQTFAEKYKQELREREAEHEEQSRVFQENYEAAARRNLEDMARFMHEKEIEFRQRAQAMEANMQALQAQSMEQQARLQQYQEEQLREVKGLDNIHNQELLALKQKHQEEMMCTMRKHTVERDVLANQAKKLEYALQSTEAKSEQSIVRLKGAYAFQMERRQKEKEELAAFEKEVARQRAIIEQNQKERADQEESVDFFQSMAESLNVMNKKKTDSIVEAKEAAKRGMVEGFLPMKLVGELDTVEVKKIYEETVLQRPIPAKPKTEDDENMALEFKMMQTSMNARLQDNSWMPFKVEGTKNVVNYEDDFLVFLKNKYSPELMELVAKERLLLHNTNASGSYAMSVAWNKREDRELSLAEIIDMLITKLKTERTKKRSKMY